MRTTRYALIVRATGDYAVITTRTGGAVDLFTTARGKLEAIRRPVAAQVIRAYRDTAARDPAAYTFSVEHTRA